MRIAEEDRDEHGRIMMDAQNRAAARETPPEAPDEPGSTRKLSNRRGHTAPVRPVGSYKRAIGIVGGLIGGLLLIVLSARLLPGAPAPLAERVQLTAATNDGRRTTNTEHAAAADPATITAYAAPDGVALGPIPADSPLAYRHSEHAGWGGVRWQGKVVWVKGDAPSALPDLAPPTPAPTVERVYVPVPVEPPCDPSSNPRYTATVDVSADGRPLGTVTGASCDSQADAQTKADQRAAEMRAAVPTAAPPATPSAIVPRPPTNRPKPMQPSVTHDSGQSPIEIQLAAAGWPITAILKGVQL